MFTALLFGFKTAPLLYSRLAALVSRWLQSLVPPSLAAHQTYLDDSLWVHARTFEGEEQVSGSLMGLFVTMEAIGLKVAYNKSHRASTVQWIGVTFSIINRDEVILGLPSKFLEETLATLKSWSSKGYVPLKDLRSLAGRLILGGRSPTSSTLDSVGDVRCPQDGAGERAMTNLRAGGHQRPWFAVKRLEQARLWAYQLSHGSYQQANSKVQAGKVQRCQGEHHDRCIARGLRWVPGHQQQGDLRLCFGSPLRRTLES